MFARIDIQNICLGHIIQRYVSNIKAWRNSTSFLLIDLVYVVVFIVSRSRIYLFRHLIVINFYIWAIIFNQPCFQRFLKSHEYQKKVHNVTIFKVKICKQFENYFPRSVKQFLLDLPIDTGRPIYRILLLYS